MRWVGRQCVIVVFPNHTHLFFDLVKIKYAVETKQPQEHITKTSVLKDYPEAFKCLGSIPGECTIHLNRDSNPNNKYALSERTL